MQGLSTFISEDFGSVAAAGAAFLAVPGVIIAGAIQGNRALKGALAQADAARHAAQMQADKALEAARAQAQAALQAAQGQAEATLETGRQQADATLASIREMSREAHAQWQRDRCQEIWAEYVKELDLLLARDTATDVESEARELRKAYAMVELMSPAGVLAKAYGAMDEALVFGLTLFVAHQHARDRSQLYEAERLLRSTVRGSAAIREEAGGRIAEVITFPDGNEHVISASSQGEADEMWDRLHRGVAGRAALDALATARQAREDGEVRESARQALISAGFGELEAGSLVSTVQRDADGERQILERDRCTLQDARDAFVLEARRELDALGA